MALRQAAYLQPGDVFPAPTSADHAEIEVATDTEADTWPQCPGLCDGDGCRPPVDPPLPRIEPPLESQVPSVSGSDAACAGGNAADQCLASSSSCSKSDQTSSPSTNRCSIGQPAISADSSPADAGERDPPSGQPDAARCMRQPQGNCAGCGTASAEQGASLQQSGPAFSKPDQYVEHRAAAQPDVGPSGAIQSDPARSDSVGRDTTGTAGGGGGGGITASSKPPVNKLLDYIRRWSVKRSVSSYLVWAPGSQKIALQRLVCIA